MNPLEYRVKELERQVKGLQTQTAKLNHQNAKQDRQIRDLDIRTAVLKGTPQKEVAKVYNLSAARVSQIARKVG